jgi:hypothetical protein
VTQIEMNRNELHLGTAVARLLLFSLAGAAGTSLVGYWPTAAVAGAAGVHAMFAGIAVALLGGWVGLLPCFFVLRRDPRQQVNGILGGLGVRFAATLALAAAVFLTGVFAPRPLVLWVAIAQLAVLAVDTIGLVSLFKRTPGATS